ncbi:hypothetical protein CC2G_013200 [Coprinopsis cinerea AmutBmut pab1-1]|nr:hypothetical protein CC2G_013200 [Coprinopsis cinerea AmutBmut pab1-1]
MAPPNARTHIYKLPSELLSKLATTVYLHSPSDIPTCTLVSKQFNAAFRPLLFHTITLGPADTRAPTYTISDSSTSTPK